MSMVSNVRAKWRLPLDPILDVVDKCYLVHTKPRVSLSSALCLYTERYNNISTGLYQPVGGIIREIAQHQ